MFLTSYLLFCKFSVRSLPCNCIWNGGTIGIKIGKRVNGLAHYKCQYLCKGKVFFIATLFFLADFYPLSAATCMQSSLVICLFFHLLHVSSSYANLLNKSCETILSSSGFFRIFSPQRTCSCAFIISFFSEALTSYLLWHPIYLWTRFSKTHF